MIQSTSLNFRCSPEPAAVKLSEVNLEGADIDATFSCSVLNVSLTLLSRLADLWRETASAFQIFKFLSEKLIPVLPMKKLHEAVRKNVELLAGKISVLKSESRDRKGAALIPKQPVKMLKLYDPEIEDE